MIKFLAVRFVSCGLVSTFLGFTVSFWGFYCQMSSSDDGSGVTATTTEINDPRRSVTFYFTGVEFCVKCT